MHFINNIKGGAYYCSVELLCSGFQPASQPATQPTQSIPFPTNKFSGLAPLINTQHSVAPEHVQPSQECLEYLPAFLWLTSKVFLCFIKSWSFPKPANTTLLCMEARLYRIIVISQVEECAQRLMITFFKS